MFYDHNLTPLPNYNSIIWPESGRLESLAKYSQFISTFSSVFPKDKTFVIIAHKSLVTTNTYNADYIIANDSDHILDIGIDGFTNKTILLNYNFNLDRYYPFWMVLSSYMSTLQRKFDILGKRPHKASYIYGKIRIPRVYTVVELNKKSYYGELDITMSNHSARHTNINEVISGEDNLSIDDISDIFGNYTQLQQNLRPGHDQASEWDLINVLGKGYEDSYLNIVAEGRIADLGMLTEKTFKPIRAGQLFLVQGPPNTVKFLRSMGFDVFDDYIDHDRYDSEPDWKRRTTLMLSVLDDIYSNIEDIFFQTMARRQKNQLWLQSNELNKLCLKQVVQQL